MTTIPNPATLWHDNYDEALSGNPEDALDRVIRVLLADGVPDITVAEIDRITPLAVEAGRVAILDAIEAERKVK